MSSTRRAFVTGLTLAAEVKADVIIVKDASGKTEEIAVLKEDTDDNKVDHEGTEYEVEEDG